MLFNIQKCSIHDGYGLRTLVFFKGCPLRCKWCANPESQLYESEIMEFPQRCIGCGACIRVCEYDGIILTDEGLKIDREKCRKCFKCVDICYAAAKTRVGENYTATDVFKEIKKDKIFYSINGGGVTFSGGEPFTHIDDFFEIAKLCKEENIDIAVETCGLGKIEEIEKVLPYINHIFFDVKHIDSKEHKKITGSGNETILNNLNRLMETEVSMTIRTPIIPNINSDEKNIYGIAKMLSTSNRKLEYELLPYHQLGVNKYKSLGRKYSLNEIKPPDDITMKNLVMGVNKIFEESNQKNKVCFYLKDNERIIK